MRYLRKTMENNKDCFYTHYQKLIMEVDNFPMKVNPIKENYDFSVSTTILKLVNDE